MRLRSLASVLVLAGLAAVPGCRKADAPKGGAAKTLRIAFVPKGTWGGRYAGEYFFADFVCGSIWRLDQQLDASYVAEPLAPAANPVTLTFGPSPQGRALYYAEYLSGEIRRITAS